MNRNGGGYADTLSKAASKNFHYGVSAGSAAAAASASSAAALAAAALPSSMDSLINPALNPYAAAAAATKSPYPGHYPGHHQGAAGQAGAAAAGAGQGRSITDFFGKMMSFSSQSAAMASVLSPPYYSHHAPNPNGGNHGVSQPTLPGGHNLYGGTDTKLNSHL